MSYTNTELVSRHLIERYPVQADVIDQAVVLSGSEDLVFYGGPIDESSLVVKSARGRIPSRTTIAIETESTIVATAPLIPGSITIASDSSLGTVYVENEDYVIDHANATLKTKPSGRLQVGMTVVVWYLAFCVYQEGLDYTVDATAGTIRRLLTGNIVSGEQVYLDYRPLHDSLGEEMLEAAVAEANGLIERAVDPERQFGADPVLQTAATCRALEIVCRTAVTRDLSNGQGNDRTAAIWMKLADYYGTRSDDLLKSFRPPATNISKPTLS